MNNQTEMYEKPSDRILQIWASMPKTKFTTVNSKMIGAILKYLDEQWEIKNKKLELTNHERVGGS